VLDNILTKEASILILEDSLADANLMGIELNEADIAFSARRVETRAEFIKAVEASCPHLILADYHLPAFNGLEALALAQEICPDVPFVIVTGALGEERAVECIKKGATDFLLKDNMTRLPQVVLRALREGQEKYERKQAEQARNRLIDILEVTTDFVGMADLEGKLVYVNQMGRKLRGYKEGKYAGDLNLSDFHPPHIVEFLRQKAIPMAMKQGVWSGETIILDHQGEEYPGLQSIIAHRDQEGKLEYFSTIVRDISLLKKAEDQAISAIVRGQDQERKRIARELHDGLGQTLTAASLNLEAVKQKIFQLDPAAQQLFHTAFQLILSAIRESREISHNLMPKVIEDFGLIPALENLLNKVRQAADARIRFYHHLSDKKLDYEVELNLFRIAQEALSNILRHANARHISVQLIEHEDTLIYTIEDDGKGFDLEEVKKHGRGIGLMSMKNRVVSIGGKISIDSAPGAGTIIAIELSLQPHEKFPEEISTHAGR